MMNTLRKSFRRIKKKNRDDTPNPIIPDNKNSTSENFTDNITQVVNQEPLPTTAPSLARFQDDTPIDESKHPEWQNDERNVRAGNCSFKVKFIGFIEVQNPRGMPACEEAVKELKTFKKNKKKYGTSNPQVKDVDSPEPPRKSFISRMSFRSRKNKHSKKWFCIKII